MIDRPTPEGAATRFIGLSTGRAGSRYLAKLLNGAGVKTLHESKSTLAVRLNHWTTDGLKATRASPEHRGVLGEISAHFVTQIEKPLDVQLWHFSRHPQPFVSSLIKFKFWGMNAPSIHPYLRRTGGSAVGNSFLYWVDWNRRILDAAPRPQRTTFRIEDVSRELIASLAGTIGAAVDITKIEPAWNEVQEFAEIPDVVAGEVGDMMGVLGYA